MGVPRSVRPTGHHNVGQGGATHEAQERKQYAKKCKRCGAVRTDNQIGRETAPDCLGWASNSSCGKCYVCMMRGVAAELWRVLRDDGTFWLNLGDKMESKQLLGIPWRVALALQADGWILRSDIIWHAPNKMPGSQQDRVTTAHEYIFLFAKQQRYFYDGHAISEHGSVKRSVWTISVASEKESHFAVFPEKLILPCILAGTSEKGCCTNCGAPRQRIVERKRTATRPGTNTKVTGDSAKEGNRDPERHITSALTIGWEPTCQCDNESTKPCTVLDPFMGSGTTLATAIKKNRDAIGIELNEDYIEIAERKLKKAIARKGFGL